MGVGGGRQGSRNAGMFFATTKTRAEPAPRPEERGLSFLQPVTSNAGRHGGLGWGQRGEAAHSPFGEGLIGVTVPVDQLSSLVLGSGRGDTAADQVHCARRGRQHLSRHWEALGTGRLRGLRERGVGGRARTRTEELRADQIGKLVGHGSAKVFVALSIALGWIPLPRLVSSCVVHGPQFVASGWEDV